MKFTVKTDRGWEKMFPTVVEALKALPVEPRLGSWASYHPEGKATLFVFHVEPVFLDDFEIPKGLMDGPNTPHEVGPYQLMGTWKPGLGEPPELYDDILMRIIHWLETEELMP